MNRLKGKLAIKGERGYSAYEIAVLNGFKGTEEEWISSLALSELPITTLEINKNSGDDKYPTAKTVYNTLNSLNNIGQVILQAGTNIINDFEVLLPLNYIVGKNMLEIYWNGTKLSLAVNSNDGHYKEIGDVGAFSNKIKFYRTEDDGNYTLENDVILDIVVKGVIT